jgi:hypothetical protein
MLTLPADKAPQLAAELQSTDELPVTKLTGPGPPSAEAKYSTRYSLSPGAPKEISVELIVNVLLSLGVLVRRC